MTTTVWCARSLRLVAGLAFAVLLAACGSAATVSQADKVADAGIAYADASAVLYDESFVLAATVNSLLLAETRALLRAETRSRQLEQQDAALAARLAVLRDLKTHASLLRSYFIALKALAKSDSATGITDATKGLAARLGELNPKIKAATLGGKPAADFIEPVVTVAVGAYQNAALRQEFAARGATIERELALQKAATEAIGAQMTEDRDQQIQLEERNPLHVEFVGTATLPKDWSRRRIEALKRTVEIASLDAAGKAADNLHRSWIALAENRLDESAVQLLLRDVEALVQLAVRLKAKD